MEKKRNYRNISINYCLHNNYVNSNNCQNISEMKMNTNKNKGNSLNKPFINKIEEESKNKDLIYINNLLQKKNLYISKPQWNIKPNYQKNKIAEENILNNQKNEEKKPLNYYHKQNRCLPFSINENNNKVQNLNNNNINNKFSNIYQNEAEEKNFQNKYQNLNNNINNMKSSTSKQIFSFQNFKVPPLIALKCFGNISYINTVLQCLLNIRNITSYFIRNMNVINTYKEQMPICYAFSKVAYNLFPDPNQPKQYINKYDPKEFYDCIFKNNLVFRGKSTKNAIDFLVYLINKIHDEDLLNPNNKNQNQLPKLNNKNFEYYCKYLQTHENSIFLTQLSYISQNIKKCWNCDNTIITFQKFFTYDLNIDLSLNKIAFEHKKELSIYDCIKYTSQEESIFNIYCNKCKIKNNFSKMFSIYLSQSVLILLLRGMEKKEIIEKMKNDNIKIKVDKDLDLTDVIYYKYKEFLKYTFHSMILYDSENKEYSAYSFSPINKKLYKYIKDKIIPVEPNNFKYSSLAIRSYKELEP